MTRDEAIKRLKVYRDYLCKMSSWFDVNEVAKPFNMAIEALEQLAAGVVPMEYHERCMKFEIKKQANMVEVVRCKECKFWQSDWETSYDGYHYCSMIDLVIDGDFYCKDGERKILPKD